MHRRETLNEVSAAKGFCIPQTGESTSVLTQAKSLQSTVSSNVFTYDTTLLGHSAVLTKKSHECGHCSKSHNNNFTFHLFITANLRPCTCEEYGQGFQQHGAFEPHVKIQKGVCMILCLKSKFYFKRDVGSYLLQCNNIGKHLQGVPFLMNVHLQGLGAIV